MINFFSIDNVLFTLWDYPMSYIEFFGTILNIICVYLIAKKNIWSWPIGIIAVILFAILFYQIQLYSDFLEQIYFLITGFYGWWLWLKLKKQENKNDNKQTIKFNSLKLNIILAIFIIIGTLGLGYFMQNIHIYFPELFPESASFPFLDAFTTIMSFVAQLLLGFKRVESWMLWITVDIIGIWLYYVKDVKFVALLYCIFLVLAISGLISWYKTYKLNTVTPCRSQTTR